MRKGEGRGRAERIYTIANLIQPIKMVGRRWGCSVQPGARAAKVRCDEQVTRTESGVTPLMVLGSVSRAYFPNKLASVTREHRHNVLVDADSCCI
jgi:hypothetical protein